MAAASVFAGILVFATVFTAICTLGLLVTVRARGQHHKIMSRIRGLSVPASASTPNRSTVQLLLSALVRLISLAGGVQTKQRTDLRTSLLRAGCFHSNAPLIFVGTKILMTAALSLAGILAILWIRLAPGIDDSRLRHSQSDLGQWLRLACLPLLGCAAGLLAPSAWLSARVRRRQRSLHNALPDALDMLVMCLESGMSFEAALFRVTDEMHLAHPVLGVEFNIVQRQMQLGLSGAEALRRLADRCGLADLHELSVVLLQCERYGASVAKTLRGYAESARVAEQLRAEEMAQKAAVKIVFPTLLCIFPAIFIVVLGPAAFQLAKLFSR